MSETHRDPGFDPQSVKGFLSAEEGALLSEAAAQGARFGEIVEIGAYCGRSTLYLAVAARRTGRIVFSVDHHRGSEEHQPGWPWHDPEVWDAEAGAVDTLPHFRRALRQAGVEDAVVALVGSSAAAGRAWRAPIGFLFLDGGHALKTALDDWRAWAGHVAFGGTLAIHDVHGDPREGGRPPFEVHRRAVASGLFESFGGQGCLKLLRRLG